MSLSEISNSTEHEDREFSDLNLTQADFSGYSFENCIFSRCNLSDATLAKVRFIYCSFIFYDLSNVALKNARIRDSAFKPSKLIGIQWVQQAGHPIEYGYAFDFLVERTRSSVWKQMEVYA